MQLVLYNHFLHCLFLCHVLIALIFIKIGLKLSYFCQKNFRAQGDPPPTPYASGGWGPCPQTPIASGGWEIHSQTHTTPPPLCRFLATGLHEEKFTARFCRPPFILAFGFKYAWNALRICSHSRTVYNTAKSISPGNTYTEKLSQKNPFICTNPTLALAMMRFFLSEHCTLF